MKFTTKNSAQTIKLGKKLAQSFVGGEVIALIGDLGLGKTTFIKGVARGLGVKKPIRSPSFVLMNSYQIPGKNKLIMYHLDAYRLNSSSDISSLGLDDILGQPKTIVLVEWADRVMNKLWGITQFIKFEFIGKEKRSIEIKFQAPNSKSQINSQSQ